MAENAVVPTRTEGITHLMTSIISTKSNIRKINNKSDEFSRLKENIDKVGLLQPIVVYKDDDGRHIVLLGHKRFSACRELKHDSIPVRVIDKPDDQALRLLQYSENMFRIDMSIYEEVMALKGIVKDFPDATYEDLSFKFGKTTNWIAGRLRLINLHKDLLVPGCLIDENTKDLRQISMYSLARQKKAIDKYCEYWHIKIEKFRKQAQTDDLRISSLLGFLKNNTPDMDDVRKIFTKEETNEYWNEYKLTKKTVGLFAGLVIDIDFDFVQYCCEQKYPEVMEVMRKLKVDPELNSWDNANRKLDWNKPFIVKDITKYLRNVVAWNGDFANPTIKESKHTKASSTINGNDRNEETPQYSTWKGYGTRLARIVVPAYRELVLKGVPYNEDTFGLIKKNYSKHTSCWNVSDSTRHLDFEDILTKSVRKMDIGHAVVSHWMEFCTSVMTVRELSQLANFHELPTLQQWIHKNFEEDNGKNVEFRTTILQCFKTAHLKDAYLFSSVCNLKKKDEIVDHIAKSGSIAKYRLFRLKEVFKAKDSGLWDRLHNQYQSE